MKRIEAIKKIYSKNKNSVFVLSNGLTSREALHFLPKNNTFYLLHSMGEAFSVGLGLASALENKNVVVIEGDGNTLMGLSSWSMNDFDNIKLYVLRNGTYGTTGYQTIPDIPFQLDFTEIIDIENTNEVTSNPPPAKEIITNFKNFIK